MKQQMKAVAKKEVKTHEKKMHSMKCGGKVKKYAEGGKVMEDKVPSAAEAKEMRGQVQDAKNKKAAENYQKGKKAEKTVKSYSKGGGVERKGKTKCKLI
jgi:hypothetical protein